MIFENLIKENKDAFLKKVEEVSIYLGIKENWLMFVMWFETAHTLDHRIINKITKAIGLIQFMPSTARELGTTTEALGRMSNVEQLEYVKRYLSRYQGKMKDWLDVYCAVFYPQLICKPDTYVIDRAIVAKQNPIFDLNKDLKIHKYEIRQVLIKQMPKEIKAFFE